MKNAEPKFEKKLTTSDLPPEVGEYIKVLEGKLDLTRPRREELISKGLDELTNQEIDELTNLNNEAARVLELIRKSRDKKKIVKEEVESKKEYLKYFELDDELYDKLENAKLMNGEDLNQIFNWIDCVANWKDRDEWSCEIFENGIQMCDLSASGRDVEEKMQKNGIITDIRVVDIGEHVGNVKGTSNLIEKIGERRFLSISSKEKKAFWANWKYWYLVFEDKIIDALKENITD
jgi:hypothetical protein